MPTLAELRAEQAEMQQASGKQLQAYFAAGKETRPWDGFWVVVPIHPVRRTALSEEPADAWDRARAEHRLYRPEHSVVFMREDKAAGSVAGTWWDGSDERYRIEGTPAVSGRSIDSARLVIPSTGKLLTPACFRSGYSANAVEVRFEWSVASPTPGPDAVRLSRLETPRMVAVSSSDGFAAAAHICRRLVEMRPLHFQAAPVIATSTEAASATYAVVDTRGAAASGSDEPVGDTAAPSLNAGLPPSVTLCSSDDFDKHIERETVMTYRFSDDEALPAKRAGVDARGCWRVLASTGKTLVFPADTSDIVRLRQWFAPCALAHVVLGEGSTEKSFDHEVRQRTLAALHRERLSGVKGPAVCGKRVVDGFTVYELACGTAEEAAQVFARDLRV
uniref:Uncharacterized protein n=1 Tax=Neobodo designis TaxID=312471 RepID=A0A7S1LKI8_NEODS